MTVENVCDLNASTFGRTRMIYHLTRCNIKKVVDETTLKEASLLLLPSNGDREIGFKDWREDQKVGLHSANINWEERKKAIRKECRWLALLYCSKMNATIVK